MSDDPNLEIPRRRHIPLTPGVAPSAPQSSDAAPRLRTEDDPKTRAARRAAELRDHRGSMDEGSDKFYFDRAIIPDGWDYEWKAWTVLGAENPGYQVTLARNGWEAVPAYRHPEMMPGDYKGATIDRDGQRLMERPLEITNEVRALELRKAREQVNQKEAQIRGQPAGASSPFEGNRDATFIKRSREATIPMAIPK